MYDIKIKPLREGFEMPRKATPHSAAYDVINPADFKLKYGRQIVPMGFALEMPDNLALDNRTRSGYSAKGLLAYDASGQEYRLEADVQLGLIDADYRGEVATIINVKDGAVVRWAMYLKKGQAISQMKFCEVPPTQLILADELSDTQRGTQGFGAANGE